jgi:putative transposase
MVAPYARIKRSSPGLGHREHHAGYQPAGAAERGDQAAHPRGAYLPPNAERCLRLVRALAVEMHENWLEAHRYLNMDDLREHKKEVLRMAA